MSRSQDIVLARLRAVARRWWAPGGEASPGGAGANQAGRDGPGPEGTPGSAAAQPEAMAGSAEWTDGQSGGTAPSRVGTAGHAPTPPSARGGPVAAQTPPAAVEPPAGPADLDDPPDRAPRTWLLLGGLACLVALLVAGGLALRGWPRAQAPADPVPAAPVDLRPLDEPAPTASVVVHVAGDVREPGVVVLPPGARVADALRAAGGLRRGGRLGPTNLARVLSDGERIEVGARAAYQATGPAGTGSTGPVDLNTATAQQLDALPGVGPVTAAKILAWRSEHGRFSVVDELAEVPGIGPKTLAELRPLVRV